MKKFESLAKTRVKEQENAINEYWDSFNILQATIDNREGCEEFPFLEGPPTANNKPGIHHTISRTLKDSICKYHTMKGKKVLRKAGWDTHGLPVELEVEKELGFNDKNDIEKYGIKEFNEKCKESVWKYKQEWETFTKSMGYFIDMESPYITFDNNYIETEWWILKKFFDAGLIYEGHKVMPYCTRCGTGLASHEVAQGYQEVTVTTVIVPMELLDDEGDGTTFMLVWTTTPWTLLSNVAVCVNPKETYVKAKSKGYNFILAESLVSRVLGDDSEIIKTYKGTDLEHKEYKQLMPFLTPDKKAFLVTCDEYVTTSDGTGIVHIAPAFGAEDAEVGKRYSLPFLNPVNEEGKFTEGPFKGKWVMDADEDIINWLKSNDKLFKKEKFDHNYPHCWRCKTPLLYYSKPSWYIEMSKLKDDLVANNNKINWYPDFVGEKRFGNWLENIQDWALSRNRYWGTPLNIWRCPDCNHLESIGSREELVNLAIEDITEDIELHRPYVDDVHIKCDKCNSTMSRVEEVIDCWFDSGAAPYAQWHYPFENKEMFDRVHPASFISEGIDQTRGWFYSLHAISTFVDKKEAYKNCLVNDHILDKNGKKMSKSLRNFADPFELFETYGADACRWYLLSVSPVWFPTKFDEEGLKDTVSKFFNTLKNTYSFFEMYANADEIDPREYTVDYNELDLIDKWLLSKYNNLVKNVTEEMDKYDLHRSVLLIQDFVANDLSNWYIRRNRRRFWESELTTSKKAVYQTTYEVLCGICKLIAPIVPFASEIIYRNLTNEKSVHLADFPEVDTSRIDNKVEEKMDLVIELISMGRNVREDSKIKVRQPISEVIIESKYKETIADLGSLILEELNVKKLSYTDDMNEYTTLTFKPNFKTVGKTFGSNLTEFTNYLNNITDADIKLLNSGNLEINLGGNNTKITNDSVLKSINPKDGYNAVMLNYKILVLNTELTNDLLEEGLTREFVSKIQNLRKTNDYDVSDRIKIYYESDEEFKKSISNFINYIKEETLAVDLIEEKIDEKIKVNEYEVGLRLERVD